ncbi:hypothetical protein BDW22DRAFT_494953 [Trametopsis cervina]|nr:hypothetical protein BDW22DRAFT_494953 [Trametopsis cervina]
MEGREAFTSWNRSCSPAVDKAQVGSPIRDAGFTTPILKPRVPKEAIDSNKEEPETVATPLVKATQVAVRPKKRARESADNRAQDAARPAKRSRGAPDESVTKSTRHTKVHEKRDGSSDRERIAILSGRRERRRVKKAIVQPKPSPQKSADMPPKGNRKGGKKRKNDISAGLALMHGFSATNVGSSRLTLKPTFGVFNKGKASAKTGTSSKAKPKPSKSVFLCYV